MLRAIKFVLDTKEFGLKLEPKLDEDNITPARAPKKGSTEESIDNLMEEDPIKVINESYEWTMVMFVDSDHAGDKENRISVTGFILYLMNVPIVWRSKAQKSVTLSSSEAEYFALSEAAKEIKFVYMILQSMGIQIKTPIKVRVDNVGAIYMSGMNTTSNRTKHIDIRYHFVREYVEDKFIDIVYVRTKENDADIFTKNVDGTTYEEHAYKFITKKSFIEE
jgi:hypothetical protein